MVLKKSTITLYSGANLSVFSPPASITSFNHSFSTTHSRLSLQQYKTRNSVLTQWRSSRSYATVKDDGQRSDRSRLDSEPNLSAWPKADKPTPYEVFNQAKSAPYSKKKFYELVKLYHPDHHLHSTHPGHDTISDTTKLERYRLIVAANSILSDPAKRRAYDLYGAGWDGQNDMTNETYREADRAWRRGANSAAHNATWEDWERWHDKHNGNEKQQPVYMSNGMFLATLAVFVVIASWNQATRASTHSANLLDMQQGHHKNISEDMWRRKKEKAYLTREDRVESFLRERQGWAEAATNHSNMPKD